MKKGTKIGLAVGFLGIGGFLIWNTISRAKNFANKLIATPMWYGKPSDMEFGMRGWKLPLAVDLTNRSDFSVKVQLNSFDVVNSAGKVIANNIDPTKPETIPANGTKRIVVDVWIPLSVLISVVFAGVQSISQREIDILTDKGKELIDGCTMKFSLTINDLANVGIEVVLDEKEEIPVEQPVSGLGLVAKTQRRIGSIQDYIDLIPSESKLLRNDDYIQSNVSPEETASFIRKMAKKYRKDTEELAYALERETIDETVQAIFDFVYYYIKYEEDAPDREQVRRPLRTLYEQKGDCDCYAMLIASICENLDLNYKLRIAEYNNRGYYQHIYCIVEGYTCDPVLDTCFEEKRPTKKKDF